LYVFFLTEKKHMIATMQVKQNKISKQQLQYYPIQFAYEFHATCLEYTAGQFENN